MMIHRLWFGPRDMPQPYRDYGRMWEEMTGLEVHDWGYDDLPPLRNQRLFDTCGDLWGGLGGAGKQSTAKQVQQADIAAYELLDQFGGLYVNCDLEPLKPIDDLCGDRAWVARSPHPRYTSNAVMYSPEAGHPFFDYVISELPLFVASRVVRAMNKQTGPALLSACVDARPELVDVQPTRFFFPFDYYSMDQAHREYPDAYAKHHWGHQTPDDELWPGEEPLPSPPPQWLLEAGAYLHAMGVTITEDDYQIVKT